MDTGIKTPSVIEVLMEYASSLLKWSWLLILVTLIFGGVTYYLTNRQPRIYKASTKILVSVRSEAQSIDSYTQSLQLAGQYATLMTTKTLLNATAKKLGYPITGSVQTQVDDKYPIIAVSVTDTDPKKAAETANAVVAEFSEEQRTDQSSRYTELETNIEAEIARIDKELTAINEKLAAMQTDTSGSKDTSASIVDTATFVNRSQLELSLTQLTQTRYSLVYNLQQVKLSEINSQISITQLDPAVRNPTPIQPKPLKNALSGALLGIVVAAGIILVIISLQDEIKNPDEIMQKMHVPVLGLIPHYQWEKDAIISFSDPRSPSAEAYRLLRTNLQFFEANSPLHSVLVTSSTPGEGKSSLVANLGQVMSQIYSSVVIIDCDLHRPSLHKFFQLSNHTGLTDLFIHNKKYLSEVLQQTKTENIQIISAGTLPPNPSEVLNSKVMVNVMDRLNKDNVIVFLDSPPLLSVADALVLAPRVDGVIVVMDTKMTTRRMLEHSIEQLRQVNARILGVVLNDVKINRLQYGYMRKYYGKKYRRYYDKAKEQVEEIEKIETTDHAMQDEI